MKSAVLEKPAATGALDADRLRALVLVRIASAADGLSKTGLAADLAALAALSHCRRAMARADGARDRGAGRRRPGRHGRGAAASQATPASPARPSSWASRATCRAPGSEVHEVRLIAKALGLEREPAKRLSALATADGLRAAIVQKAFGLKITGRGDAVAVARRAGRGGAGARLRQPARGGSRRQARAVGQGRPSARRPAGEEAARFRHRRPPGRGAGRRARGRVAGRPCPRCAWPCCAATSTGPTSRPRGRARRQRLPSRGRGWSRRRLRRRRLRRSSRRRDLAGFAQGGAPARRSARPGLARQPQGLHQPRLASRWPSSAPSGASRRSSSSAC